MSNFDYYDKRSAEFRKTADDFRVDGRITFEVGGESISFAQIADLPDSYILADNIEFPIGKKLPIWLLGLIY